MFTVDVKQQCNETYVVTPHSQWDSSNDGAQNMFLWKNMDNYPKMNHVSSSPLLIWSTDKEHVTILLSFTDTVTTAWDNFYSMSAVVVRTDLHIFLPWHVQFGLLNYNTMFPPWKLSDLQKQYFLFALSLLQDTGLCFYCCCYNRFKGTDSESEVHICVLCQTCTTTMLCSFQLLWVTCIFVKVN